MILNSPTISGSLTVTGNIITSGSITLSGSVASASYAQNATTAATSSFANAFTVAGTLTAQTLVVQTITSSVDFVTGSTRFGSIIGNTHQFTGSVGISGALSGASATFSGLFTINATTGTAAPGAKALSIRDSGNTAYGFDFNLEGVSTGDLYLMRTNNNVQSAILQIARSTGAATFTSTAVGVATFNSTYGQMGIQFANNGTIFGLIGSGNSVCSTASNDDLGIGTYGLNKSIVFATGTGYIERFRIASNGAATFSSSVTASGGFFNGNGSFTNNGFWGTLLTTGTGSYSDFAIIDNTSTQIMRVPTGTRNVVFSGNVTADSINLTGDAAIQNTTTGKYLALYGNTGGMYLGAYNGGNQNYMRITGGGNVLIGTTTDYGMKVLIRAAGNTGESDAHFALSHPDFGAFHFMDATAYWIGQNSAYKQLRMYSGGSIYTGVYLAAGGSSWTSYSDERMKTDLLPIESALDKVAELRAVTGRFKTDDENKSRSFLIAQDVQKVFPQAVTENNDEMKSLGVQYTDVVPLLVKAIQEQQAEIEAQAAQIQELKELIAAN